MNYKVLRILILSTAISLIGIMITQSLWLKKTFELAERQFDHRADQLLSNVVDELKTYADTSFPHKEKSSYKHMCIYDVVDTNLLGQLIAKYTAYHNLDTIYSFALVTTATNKILHKANGFSPCEESKAYKVCLSCIWQEEYIHLSIFFPNKEEHILGKQIIWIALSILFILLTMGTFVFIVLSIYKQRKIAEIKNDFVNNMTHELKTPLSTISVASEVLMKMQGGSKDGRLERYSKVIFEENQRMRKLVDKVLNIATLDRGLITLDREEINIHETIYQIVENFCFEACQNQVLIDYQLDASNFILRADKIHLRNILNNLVDNAVKYSDKEPKIKVNTQNIEGFFKVSITDTGKGIPKESLNKVFDKFYRVPSGNVHNVKGFGLGLFYVKTIVEAHGGKIELQSILNKGTTISVFLPQ